MRMIQSPGIQITEKDLSLRASLPIGTTCLVTGFAPQGPTNEPLIITTVSELETVFGIPTTPAERYFYYSCREVLNTPGVLTALRLPYGDDSGNDFTKAVTGLFYPMASGMRFPLTFNEEASAFKENTDGTPEIEWVIGSPAAISLTEDIYQLFKTGNFEWGSPSIGLSSVVYEGTELEKVVNPGSAGWFPLTADDGTITSLGEIAAGFMVFNDMQTNINELGEGYYVGFADNLATLSSVSPDFDSIKAMNTLIGEDQLAEVPSTRLDFQLSSTAIESNRGVTSISESLEKVGFVDFETHKYQDHLSLGVFKIRRSTADPAFLTLGQTERYTGSFDYNRKQVSRNGGILANSFVEDIVNTSSPTIKMFVNPLISKTFDWTFHGSSYPTARLTVHETAKNLMPLGQYSPDTRSAEELKTIGIIPKKLDRGLRSLEAIEDLQIDIITDSGLSTIFANTHEQGGKDNNDKITSLKNFNDEKFIANPTDENILQNWQSVTLLLVNFAQNVRKDCIAIIDPLRQTFINGRDAKISELKNKEFSNDIYKPLRLQAAFESNYAVMYGNWIKIMDLFSGRKFWMPFSGYAASIFAKSDAVAQPWAAPAGLNRGKFNALDIAFNPNQKQRDRLYEISVNPVVFFNGDGYAVMGQKTLQTKPTAFDRVNVRRLFLYLERATQRTLKYFVFEPNTDFTRSRLVNVIAPIFEYAKLTEGLYDYLIVADRRNNTSDTIDQNELIVDIYIKPVRTAEFILVNFIATRTGQNFAELI